jgi:hypothetical protein
MANDAAFYPLPVDIDPDPVGGTPVATTYAARRSGRALAAWIAATKNSKRIGACASDSHVNRFYRAERAYHDHNDTAAMAYSGWDGVDLVGIGRAYRPTDRRR